MVFWAIIPLQEHAKEFTPISRKVALGFGPNETQNTMQCFA